LDRSLAAGAHVRLEARHCWRVYCAGSLRAVRSESVEDEEIRVSIVAYMVLTIHVICALGLVIFVLLHSGKGTGVSSLFGAGMPSSATGTGVIEKNLDRITIAFAAGYGITALLLMLVYRPAI
jgi:preprotein translocase subunit SecG